MKRASDGVTSNETREIPALSLRASFQPDTLDEEKRTVEVVWSTGAKVLRGFYDRFWEELSLDPKHVRMDRLKSGRAPLLNSHTSYDLAGVLGVVESARIEKGQGVARVRFAKAEDDPEADKIFRKVKDGITPNISVGYRVHTFEKIESVEDKIPTYRAVDWEPYEISLVPMPADAGAGVRSAQQPSLPLGELPGNPCLFITREERKMPEQIKPETTTTPAVPSEAPASLDAAREAKVREEAVRSERERSEGIRSAVRAAKLDDKFAEKLVVDGVALDAARKLVFDELAKRDESVRTEQHIRVEITDDSRDKFVRGASAWLIEKAGATDLIRSAAKASPKLANVELDGGEFRGMSLMDLARESLERRGIKTRGMDRMALAKEALLGRAGSYQTPGDFAVLFENVLGKILLGSYAVTPDTWTRFCGKTTVPDFRPSPRFRTGSLTVLDSLNDHGEFKTKSIPDGEKTSVDVATKGNIIGVSRKTIVNDDMSALTDLATKLGRAGKLTIEADVYALIALNSGLGPTMSDAQPFFHSNRSNVNATGSAISTSGIDADRVVMAQQRDVGSNEYLDLRPAVLLVPVGLGGQARVINSSQYDPDTVANKAQMKPNMVVGLFRDVVDTPRLSGTRRYLFADPLIAPAFVVAFLEGQGESPTIEMQEGWRNDGVEWKARLDFKAQAFDPKGAVTNAGA